MVRERYRDETQLDIRLFCSINRDFFGLQPQFVTRHLINHAIDKLCRAWIWRRNVRPQLGGSTDWNL